MLTLGEEIKRLRLEAGMTQGELSQAAGISQPMIALIESGKREGTNSKYINQLCAAFNVPTDHFAPFISPGVSVPPPPSNTVQVVGYDCPLVGTVGASDVDTPEVFEVPEQVRTVMRYQPGTIALRVRGTSCEPRIPDGSIVIVEPASEPVDGKFHVVANAVGYTLKLYTEGKLFRLGPTRKAIRLDASTRLVGIVRYVFMADPEGE